MRNFHLSFFIGGFFSDNIYVLIKNKKLHYAEGIDALSERNVRYDQGRDLSEIQMTKLNELLDQIGVWKWKKNYTANVCDGLQWTIKINSSSGAVNTYGSNSYPGSDSMKFSPEFIKLLKMLSKLSGKKIFI